MGENFLTQMTLIATVGIGAQWIAWRLKLPAIVLLLAAGVILGPATGLVEVDRLFGDALFPIVSLSVAVILFEGGLSLRVAELKEVIGVVGGLISIGMVVTWVVSTAAAYLFLGMSLDLAVLLGAILVVTGPTVLVPLLRHVRPVGKVGPVLKWEGIVIDPIGAVLAVIVYEAVFSATAPNPGRIALVGIVRTVAVGGAIGFAGAAVKVLILRRFWAPDWLENPVSVALVFGAFAVSNALRGESGLLAVTAWASRWPTRSSCRCTTSSSSRRTCACS